MLKKWLWIAAIAACTAMLLTAALFGEAQRIRQTDEPAPSELSRRPWRIIGMWNDRVAVYMPQTDMPLEVYDAAVSSLPAEEQARLREGIEVFDSETLAHYLEDYLS